MSPWQFRRRRRREGLGRDDDALKLHEKAVALWTAALGERHPSTLTSMSNHARALAHVGRAYYLNGVLGQLERHPGGFLGE